MESKKQSYDVPSGYEYFYKLRFLLRSDTHLNEIKQTCIQSNADYFFSKIFLPLIPKNSCKEDVLAFAMVCTQDFKYGLPLTKENWERIAVELTTQEVKNTEDQSVLEASTEVREQAGAQLLAS